MPEFGCQASYQLRRGPGGLPVSVSAVSTLEISQSFDWMGCGVRACGKKLASILQTAPNASYSPVEFAAVLDNWSIRTYRPMAAMGGSTRGTFLIETADGDFVLRRSDSDEREWVSFQLGVLRHLRKSRFPYDIPKVVPTATGAAHVFDGRDYWYLYDFIKGMSALEPRNRRRARDLGMLVGSFAHALDDFDVSRVAKLYWLQLFQFDDVADRFIGARCRLADAGSASDLLEALDEHGDAVLQLHAATESTDIASVGALPRTPVYYDWHSKNIITRWGATAGLIDYDSLGVAPRIVDFQNALSYVLIARSSLEPDLAHAFARAYRRVAPLAAEELALIHPVMVDRATWLLADLLESLAIKHSRGLAARARRLIGLLVWLKDNRELLTSLIAMPIRNDRGLIA